MNATARSILEIEELRLGDKLEQMTELQFEAYCKKLDEFIDTFPQKEAELKENFSVWNDRLFIATLTNIQSMLSEIYASELAQDSIKLITDIKISNRKTTEAHMTFFLTEVSSLSIDIQMALNGSAHTVKRVTQEQPKQKVVMAVDDMPLILDTIKSIATDAGYKFTGVTSGYAALNFLTKQSPDLFILDVEMPMMDGYDLAARIRELGHKAPIVFLTGNATKEYVLKAIQAGAADFMVKPVIFDQVRKKIKKFIGD